MRMIPMAGSARELRVTSTTKTITSTNLSLTGDLSAGMIGLPAQSDQKPVPLIQDPTQLSTAQTPTLYISSQAS